MTVITKYKNRKFYANKTHMTLRDLKRLDRGTYRVVCHKTKRDITEETNRRVDFYWSEHGKF